MEPFVSIVIINWNNHQDTLECLDSLCSINYAKYQIVVVDNFSQDQSIEKIEEWAEQSKRSLGKYDVNLELIRGKEKGQLALIKNDHNAGYDGGVNLGIRFALSQGAEDIWLLNNDVIVESDALIELVKLLHADERIGIVGSKIMTYYDIKRIQDIGGWLSFRTYIFNRDIGHYEIDQGQFDRVMEPDFINGASMLVKGSLIADIGLFDENYFLYWDDADFCVRAKKKNWKLCTCPASVVWHKEGGTTEKGSKICTYYYARNCLYFYKKYNYKKFLLVLTLGFIYKILKRVFRGDFYSAKYIWKAYADFMKGKLGGVKL